MNAKNLKIGDLIVIVASGRNLPPVEITRIEEDIAPGNDNNDIPNHIYHFDNEGWGIPGHMLQQRLDAGTMKLFVPKTEKSE